MTFNNDYTCNPKYICEEIFRQKLPLDLVWVSTEKKMKNPVQYPDNVRLVSRNSYAFLKSSHLPKYGWTLDGCLFMLRNTALIPFGRCAGTACLSIFTGTQPPPSGNFAGYPFSWKFTFQNSVEIINKAKACHSKPDGGPLLVQFPLLLCYACKKRISAAES